ncbi:MAG TPA: hypothetical protein VNL69_01095 [Bacteroidota bacterium]|nr:hypothetical protein [Bacteroidota bacterium]
MKSFVVLALAIYWGLMPLSVHAQGGAAVPFLLIHPSPDANAWGNVGTAVVSENPIAVIANPGQLGMFSLDGYLSASMFAPKTKWLPTFGLPDLTYDIRALSGGYELSKDLELPFRFGVGAGYSRVFLNLGEYLQMDPNGFVLGTYRAWEKSEQFSVGFGIEYFLRVGIGLNFKSVRSRIGPLSASGTVSEAKPTATDFGLIIQAPVFDIWQKAAGEPVYLFEDVQPLFNLTLGYARSNLGDKPVVYPGVGIGDPLPRRVTIGLSAELGLTTELQGRPWRMLTFTLAREAEDLLVTRKPTGGYGFQSGLGDISFFKHVVRGKLDGDDRPDLHKGWQIGLGEFVYVRGGSFSESPNFGNRNYSTSGFGVRMSGLFKMLAAASAVETDDDILSILLHHVDVVYDHAAYKAEKDHPLDGVEFNALTLVIR